MSGLLLLKKESSAKLRIESAKEAFENKSYKLESRAYSIGEFDLIYYSDYFDSMTKVLTSLSGNFLCYCGLLIYNGKTGVSALGDIESDLANGKKIETLKLKGTFLLVVYFDQQVFFVRDLFGGYGCFMDDSQTWITTNFLAAVKLRGKVEFRKQELMENIFFNMEFGNQTVVEGITVPRGTRVYNLSKKSDSKRDFKIPELEFSLVKCIDFNFEALAEEFRDYQRIFGDRITSALSGGFDSRLVLASMRRAGISPSLYVYGADNDPDVLVAKKVCNGEGISLKHTNREVKETSEIDQIAAAIFQNMWDFDGGNNLFTPSNELGTRMERAQNGFLVLNGAGGEIYRDMWKWDFRKTTISRLFKNSYDTGELDIFNINVNDFFDEIAEKIRFQAEDFVGLGQSIERQQAENLFLIYRSNFYFQGNIINNYLGDATLPYLSENIALASFSVPYKFKRAGRFEAELIKKMDKKIASYPSEYGFSFLDGPNLKSVFQEWVYSQLSPELKATIKRSTSKSKKSVFRKSSSDNPYVRDNIFRLLMRGNQSSVMESISNLSIVKNQNTMNRIYSLSLLENINH